jgi:hypothetical protein
LGVFFIANCEACATGRGNSTFFVLVSPFAVIGLSNWQTTHQFEQTLKF